MTIEEVKQQLDSLSEKIDLINSNLQFNITTFLTILTIAIAIAGVALVLLVKNIVNKSVEKELIKMRESIKNELRLELKDYIKINQQLKVMLGTGVIGITNYQLVLKVPISKEYFENLLWKLDVFYVDNPSKKLEYDYTFNDGILDVRFKDFNKAETRIYKFKLIWLNEEMFK